MSLNLNRKERERLDEEQRAVEPTVADLAAAARLLQQAGEYVAALEQAEEAQRLLLTSEAAEQVRRARYKTLPSIAD